jgi:hypothetical protein
MEQMSNGAEEVTYYTKGDTGDFTEATLPTFRDSLPEDLRENEGLSGFEDSGALARAHLETTTKFSELQASLPAAVESVDDYQFDIPAGIEPDQPRIDAFKQFAFERKIPLDVAKDLVSLQLQYEKEARERATEEFNNQVKKTEKETLETLKKDWGDKYQSNLDLATRVTTRFADDAIKTFLDNSGFGNNPEVIKLMANIGNALSEDVLVSGDKDTGARLQGEHGQKVFALEKSFPDGA